MKSYKYTRTILYYINILFNMIILLFHIICLLFVIYVLIPVVINFFLDMKTYTDKYTLFFIISVIVMLPLMLISTLIMLFKNIIKLRESLNRTYFDKFLDNIINNKNKR